MVDRICASQFSSRKSAIIVPCTVLQAHYAVIQQKLTILIPKGGAEKEASNCVSNQVQVPPLML